MCWAGTIYPMFLLDPNLFSLQSTTASGPPINNKFNTVFRIYKFICYLKSFNSRVRSLISMPESLIAAIVLGSSSRAVSANFERDIAALPIAYNTIKTQN